MGPRRSGRGEDPDLAAITRERAAPVNTDGSEVVDENAGRLPMTPDLWKKIYVRRNDSLILLYDLTISDGPGIKKLKDDLEAKDKGYAALNKNFRYRQNNYGSELSKEIESWGELVEYLVRQDIDLNGLCLSPEQREYLFEYELQGCNLNNGHLKNAVLDGMDLSEAKFTGCELERASLKSTTGSRPDFSGARAYKADFSGARYTLPNFSKMYAPFSEHFRSVYEGAGFDNTDWTQARGVGATFILNGYSSGRHSLDISGGFFAGAQFCGVAAERSAPRLKFSRTDFSGACFYNIELAAGNDFGKRADFSPLHHDDPRLTDEEKQFIAGHKQWTQNAEAPDGAKISPDVQLTFEQQNRLYTMFSETQIAEPSYEEDVLFFSTGPVLIRSGFHECRLGELTDILPECLRKKLEETGGPVIVEDASAPPAPDKKGPSIKLPQIACDEELVQLQVAALKTASVADALKIGSDLQASLAEVIKAVGNWAMTDLGARQPVSEKILLLNQKFNECSCAKMLKTPELPPPAPAVVEEPAVRQRRALWSRTPTPAPVRAEPSPEDKIREMRLAALAEGKSRFSAVQGGSAELAAAISGTLVQNEQELLNIEALKKFAGVIEGALQLYISQIEQAQPEIEALNPDAAVAVQMRKASLVQSQTNLAELKDDLGAVMTNVTATDAACRWLQGVILPDLEVHFIRAASIQNLAQELCERDISGKSMSDSATGLYRLLDLLPSTAGKILGEAFDKARQDIGRQLAEARTLIDKGHREKTDKLKQILAFS